MNTQIIHLEIHTIDTDAITQNRIQTNMPPVKTMETDLAWFYADGV
jgi:hypothetical protein